MKIFMQILFGLLSFILIIGGADLYDTSELHKLTAIWLMIIGGIVGSCLLIYILFSVLTD